jgi:hypothetical protein
MRFESALMFLFKDELGFTLIGEKPITINWCENYELSHDKELSSYVFAFLSKAFAQSETHILNIVPLHPGVTEIQLIHKRSLSSLIAKEEKLRAFVRQYYGSEEDLFRALKVSKKSLLECFHNDVEVLGLVFGYGKSNADYCNRFTMIGHYLKKYPCVRLLPFRSRPHIESITPTQAKRNLFRFQASPDKPNPLPQFSSLEEEWEWIWCVKNPLRPGELPLAPYLFSLPQYKARTGGDADAVRQHFLRTRDKVAKLFCGRKFSEVITEAASKK